MRKPYTDQLIGYAMAIAFLGLLLPVLLVPNAYVRLVAAAVVLTVAVATCVFVKKRSILSLNKRTVLLIVTVIATLYLMLSYLLGLSYGFTDQPYSLTVSTFFLHVIPIAVIIIATEIIRAVLLGQGSRLVSSLTYLACVVAELILWANFQSIHNVFQLVDFFAMTLFPALTSNLLFHYLSKRYGIYPSIAYRLILALYGYFIPFAPNLPDVFQAFSLFLLPLIVRIFVGMLFDRRKKLAARKKQSKWGYLGMGATLVVMISVVMLISCQFRFGMLVIATDSMTGEINRGDAVIFEQYDGHPIEVGDVVVFEKEEDVKIVHRVVSIQRLGTETRYFTKGDANEDMDFGYITENHIVGTVQFKVSYIGAPSLWLRELFK